MKVNQSAVLFLSGLFLACLAWQQRAEQGEAESVPLDAAHASQEVPAVEIGGRSSLQAAPALSPAMAGLVQNTPSKADYLPDQLMVRVVSGADLAAVAARHGLSVLNQAGRSGFAALGLDGQALFDLQAELAADPAVRDCAPVAVVRGASKTEEPDLLWHLDAMQLPDDDADFSAWIAAVVDSGVAYEDYDDGDQAFVAVSSLAGSPIVAPWDFVNDDGHANDDHQHGTHVAGIIASMGAVPGVSPGVSLMPLKVLDQDNAGNELDLVEAIHYAIDNGADVINLSLAFGQAYAPSAALAEALVRAWEEQVVVVAAAGNEAANYVAYPAAHPRVIAVGASQLKSKSGKLEPATYSNLSARIDLLAPGGNLDEDANHDGISDGIVAETIALGEPSQVGYHLYAGTSQAAAAVSGSVVRLMAEGVHPWQVLHVLQRTAAEQGKSDTWKKGYGAGQLQISAALDDLDSGDFSSDPPAEFFASLLPWLSPSGSAKVRPMALITVMDAFGLPVPDAAVYATYWGEGGQDFTCTTDDEGLCEQKGSKVDLYTDDGAVRELGWAVRVSTLLIDGRAYHPGTAFFATDGLEIMLQAMDDRPELDGSLLAFQWDAAEDDAVFGDLAEGFSIVDLGTGLATSPLGVIATRPVFENISVSTQVFLDLDGTGLATSPLGLVPVTLLTMGGTGLATSPLGLVDLKLVALSGTGLATSPLGFTADALLLPGGETYDASLLNLQADAVLLGRDIYTTVDLMGTAIGTRLDRGGWITGQGYGGAMVAASSGWGGIAPVPTEQAGAGDGSEPL